MTCRLVSLVTASCACEQVDIVGKSARDQIVWLRCSETPDAGNQFSDLDFLGLPWTNLFKKTLPAWHQPYPFAFSVVGIDFRKCKIRPISEIICFSDSSQNPEFGPCHAYPQHHANICDLFNLQPKKTHLKCSPNFPNFQHCCAIVFSPLVTATLGSSHVPPDHSGGMVSPGPKGMIALPATIPMDAGPPSAVTHLWSQQHKPTKRCQERRYFRVF